VIVGPRIPLGSKLLALAAETVNSGRGRRKEARLAFIEADASNASAALSTSKTVITTHSERTRLSFGEAGVIAFSTVGPDRSSASDNLNLDRAMTGGSAAAAGRYAVVT
jgi:hypothetical protein